MNQSVEIIDSRVMIRNWGWSIALHGALWGLGLWLISQQAIVPQPTFQWEVSLVSPSRGSGDTPPSDASSQVANRIRPVAMKSVGKPAAFVQSVIHKTQAVREPVLSEARTESTESQVAVAMSDPSKAIHSPEFPSNDMAASSEIGGESLNAVDDETQEPHASNGQSAGVADPRADGSSDPPTEATVPSSTVTNANSFETKADFDWLMQVLWSRVTELKHYPPEARMNRVEGRVVVRIVIDEQGQLLDATIVTGSGHALLDHAALDVIRRSCPLSLPHALGRRQIVLRVPIQYRLDS